MRQTNRTYDSLSGIGSKNTRNLKEIRLPEETTEIGVSIERSGQKKATTLELIVPATRSSKGSRRVSMLELNGFQARELYETLRSFYESIED